MLRRIFIVLSCAFLTACASLNTVSVDVQSYAKEGETIFPGPFLFDRLPSLTAQPDRLEALESAATQALATHGFLPVKEGEEALYSVQLGARVGPGDNNLWAADPLWWRSGIHVGRPLLRPHSAWGSIWWGSSLDARYNKEVTILIRQRRGGNVVFEGTASQLSHSDRLDSSLPALFQAALDGFPQGHRQVRSIQVPLSDKPSPSSP